MRDVLVSLRQKARARCSCGGLLREFEQHPNEKGPLVCQCDTCGVMLGVRRDVPPPSDDDDPRTWNL